MLELTNNSFKNLVLKRPGNAMVFVWAPWCINCKAMEFHLELAAIEIGTENIFKIDVSEYPEIIKKYKIVGVPSILIFSYGLLVKRKTEMMSNNGLVHVFNSVKAYTRDEAIENEIKGFCRWPFDKLKIS